MSRETRNQSQYIHGLLRHFTLLSLKHKLKLYSREIYYFIYNLTTNTTTNLTTNTTTNLTTNTTTNLTTTLCAPPLAALRLHLKRPPPNTPRLS